MSALKVNNAAAAATGVCVLRPQGRLDGMTGKMLDDEITKALGGGTNKLLLDMADLEYISSAGLRVMLHAAKQLKATGGQLVLCSLNEEVKEVFDISGFSGFLDISASRDEAMGRARRRSLFSGSAFPFPRSPSPARACPHSGSRYRAPEGRAFHPLAKDNCPLALD